MLRRVRRARGLLLPVFAIILIIKIFNTIRLSVSLNYNQTMKNEDLIAEYSVKLRRMSEHLTKLQKQHNELYYQVKTMTGKIGLEHSTSGPTEKYEKKRRRIYENTNELSYFIKSKLLKMINRDKKLRKSIIDINRKVQIIAHMTDRIRSLQLDLQLLEYYDGFSKWRRVEAEGVSNLIQRRLWYLQNPENCTATQKVICRIDKACGYGCQMHHFVYCLIVAYATERTLLFDVSRLRGAKSWHHTLAPLSQKCDMFQEEYKIMPLEYKSRVEGSIMYLPYLDYGYEAPPQFIPLKIPVDLADRIIRFNGDPASWWIGQFARYLFKPSKYMQKRIKSYLLRSGFKQPIVGIHVRRSDKIENEAQLHEITEYMKHVNEYYNKLALVAPIEERRVFVATDDKCVFDEIQDKYPNYTMIANYDTSFSADRRPPEVSQILPSLRGFIVDVTLLSMCDAVVGTFSSNLGRLAYELMQASRDASNSFISLDDVYYFGGQLPHRRVAVLRHKREDPEQISFEVNDRIIVHGNHYDGFGKGMHEDTEEIGLFPWYKTSDVVETYPFPGYEQIPLY